VAEEGRGKVKSFTHETVCTNMRNLSFVTKMSKNAHAGLFTFKKFSGALTSVEPQVRGRGE
jgi:hypothetical protein